MAAAFPQVTTLSGIICLAEELFLTCLFTCTLELSIYNVALGFLKLKRRGWVDSGGDGEPAQVTFSMSH